MENPAKSGKNLKPILLLFIVISVSAPSSARPLSANLLQSLTATEPALNLALPMENMDDVFVNPAMEKDSEHVLPCHTEIGEGSDIGSARLAGKFGPMILNLLPKGTVPPSGPSKGTNSLNN
ncbi:hypothetical protein OIU74_026939 [Salix koriyanagi]|uniref:Uncharacterized protein n=1 Tax=Salix koriyanagi TaxID=2511006 RepID=A0A9Q0W2B9_9ROSI|nr:hypothetical protein OIU74_026939 [Salix koriyanagi]